MNAKLATFGDHPPDLRRPGQPMACFTLKLPAEYAVALQEHADHLGVSRGAVARHLVITALHELVSDEA